MKRLLVSIHEKLVFFAPVLVVIAIATFLVFCTYQADFIVTATVFSEEGSGSDAASAGLFNALTFILPAIIGGFGIALLFKYRKKLTLKAFFGGALFFAGTFITFFFADSILYIIRTQFYGIFILDMGPLYFSFIDQEPMIGMSEIYYVMIICCGLLGFGMAHILISRKFMRHTKNYAILFLSALMGAFLAVILPTYTIIILLVGLSIYDIYSVRHGPIKDIMKYTLEDENNYDHYHDQTTPTDSDSITQHSTGPGQKKQQRFGCIALRIDNVLDDDHNDDYDDDSILTSMTYSARDWDVGIGDLVFYSMLASQPLTPYFIYHHGADLMSTYGLWIFWLISLFTMIGILIGFVITIRLLERNSMLPGLPCSIALGLIGFLGSTIILSII